MASTHQYGDLATQLVTESRRSTLTDTLIKYNDPLVRSIIREQRQLEQLIGDALAKAAQAGEENAKLNQDDPHTPSLLIFQTAIERNKRCLLAYHQHRLDRLRDMYWAGGGSLPHLLSSADTRAKLSPHEVDFLRAYSASVVDFRGAFSDELDITANITSVPKDLHVLVRVVKDCGVIQTELGAIDFRRGQRFMVRRADIEHLIVQGYLEEV
jgi:GINS complex subunit 1